MTLEELGYNQELERYRVSNGLDSLGVARVIAEHKERYVVKNEVGEHEAEILGNLRYTAQGRADFPAVGDWVAISDYDEGKVLIHAILQRKSVIQRQAVGKRKDVQVIAANIDSALIVQAVDRDFSINRIQRYLTICHSSNVDPVIVLNKIDLVGEDETTRIIGEVQKRVADVPVYAVSNQSGEGIEKLKEIIVKGRTYCLLGSSGVGKSTLLNTIAGEQLMKTGAISEHSHRGQHVTTHREMQVLSNGGILIDNPGMREVGIADTSGGLETTFETILELSGQCRFKDCSHVHEIGCAVTAAVENGELDRSSYENYLKMEREKEHFEATIAEKRKKGKEFGKIIKHFKNVKKSNRY